MTRFFVFKPFVFTIFDYFGLWKLKKTHLSQFCFIFRARKQWNKIEKWKKLRNETKLSELKQNWEIGILCYFFSIQGLKIKNSKKYTCMIGGTNNHRSFHYADNTIFPKAGDFLFKTLKIGRKNSSSPFCFIFKAQTHWNKIE